MKRETRKKSTKKMGLSASDYRKILKFYKLSIPKKVSNLRKKGDKIIAKKFCSCIKKVRKKFKKEGIAIGICTKSVITRKGIKRGSFNCKSKTSIDLYKGGRKRSTKKNRRTRKKRGRGVMEDSVKKVLSEEKENIRDKKCLDIGTRDGLNCLTLVNYGAESVLGIDTNDRQFEVHQEVTDEKKIKLEKHNLFDMDENEKFDVITCFLWNFGLPELNNFCEKVQSLLKSGGVFYMGANDFFWTRWTNDGTVSVQTRLKSYFPNQQKISDKYSAQKIWRMKVE